MKLRLFLSIIILIIILQVTKAAYQPGLLTIKGFNTTLTNQVITNDSLWNKTIQLINAYNNYFTSLPDIVKSTIGTEVIRLEAKFLNGSKMIIGVKSENGLIKEYQKEPYNSSTLAIYLSEKGVLDIISDKDPFNALKNAWGTEIRFEGLTFFNSIKMFFADLGFRIYSFFSGLFTVMPVYRGPRSQGLTINLKDWWKDVATSVEIGVDPLGGAIYLFWLDDEGNICHGDPGTTGQPGLVLIMPSNFGELRTLRRSDATITIEELARLRNDTYDIGLYTGQGMHFVIYRNQIWRERSVGMVFEDFANIQSSYPIDVNLSDYITPNYLLPNAMLRLNNYNCSLTEYGTLAVPDSGIGGAVSGQHPTKCLHKQSITGRSIAEACRSGRLTGGLTEGYLRIT